MRKHRLKELRRIIEQRIGSLTEDVEIATNVKLHPLYIAHHRQQCLDVASDLSVRIQRLVQQGANGSDLADFGS